MTRDVGATTAGVAAAYVAGDGFVRLAAGMVPVDPAGPAFAAFRALWEDLRPDRDLVDGGTYRLRRYGRLAVTSTPDGFVVEPLPDAPFRQDGIPMWRGTERRFPPLGARTLDDPCLRALVAFDLTVAGLVHDDRDWTVGVHAIRIVARADSAGLPTPEGWHRDGHRFVGMHLVGRENVRGGESWIRRPGHPDEVFTLESPLDSVLVDDTAVWHAASPIAVRDPAGGRTVRDMLLVDVNPAGRGVRPHQL